MTDKHLAFYAGCRSEDVRLAQDLLEETLAAEEIPFDGVIGFSQGASLAISYVLQQQILKPDQMPPFRVGIFFAPGFILSPDPDYHKDIFLKLDTILNKSDHENVFSTFVEKVANEVPYRPDEGFLELDKDPSNDQEIIPELLQNKKTMLQIKDLFGIQEGVSLGEERDGHPFPRFFNPIYTPQRIPFPTVHINGVRDPTPKALAQIVKDLCAPNTVIPVTTQCGHEIPTKKQDVDNVIMAIEKALSLRQNIW